jgi:D-tyrosyl-tRNA(Tyr) deacylase
MRALIQRVTSASVTVDEKTVGEIKQGLLVLLGVEDGDQATDLEYILKKTLNLRIFSDTAGKMNLSVKDIAGELLVVSQFTLLGDTRKGNRPGFTTAAHPEIANRMYEQFVSGVREQNLAVATGVFAADMQVQLVNDGPVTLMIDSRANRAR